MKLAEALKERAELKKKIYQLSERLKDNAKVQEGELPAEDPKFLLEELDSAYDRLEYLIIAINHTNAIIQDGQDTLAKLLARHDCLKKKIAILREFLSSASELTFRMAKNEIKIKSSINVSEMTKKVDHLSEELRLLDLRIQQQNWIHDLIE